jgi:hypothetical protein
MLDRAASISDEVRQRPQGVFAAQLPLRIRAANDRRTPFSNRHRRHRRDHPRSRPSATLEALHDEAASSTVCASSPDGVLAFILWERPHGVVVQRSELRPGDGRVVLSMMFASAHAFVTWCQSDHLRFAYPLLFVNLARSGCELFDRAS